MTGSNGNIAAVVRCSALPRSADYAEKVHCTAAMFLGENSVR